MEKVNIIDSKHLQLARKLKALADRGIGGEKTNAKAMLNKLLSKYRLTKQDLESEEIKEYSFKVKEDQIKFFYQVGSTILGEHYMVFIEKPYDGRVKLKCTNAQAIEIAGKWNFYKKLYHQELEVFYISFIQANNLFAENVKPVSILTLSPEEQEKIRRAAAMAPNIDAKKFYKQSLNK